MFLQVAQPWLEQGWLVLREYESPQADRHRGGEDTLSKFCIEPKPKREVIEVFELGRVGGHLRGDLWQARLERTYTVHLERAAPSDKLGPAEAAHGLRVEPPREEQHPKLIRTELQIGTEALHALGQDRVLRRVPIRVEQRRDPSVRDVPRAGASRLRASFVGDSGEAPLLRAD